MLDEVLAGDVTNAGPERGSAAYLVRRPVVLAGRRLRQGQQFTLDVRAEEIFEGGSSKRENLVGPFSPTSGIYFRTPGN